MIDYKSENGWLVDNVVKLDIVQLRLWRHRDESSEDVYYALPKRYIEQLALFVKSGVISPEIEPGLGSALQEFPSWKHLPLGEQTMFKERRSSIAGNFVMKQGRRINLEFELDLDVTLY